MNGKRIFDICIACFLLPLLGLVSPVMWIAGRLSQYQSLIFSQVRVGLEGEPIRIVKFRSLRLEGDKLRSNPFFNFVRKTGLDELPQILLILRGTMSVIGPRPLLEEDLYPAKRIPDPSLAASIRIRQSAKPGMAGLPLLTIPNRRFKGDAYNRMIVLDVWYVQNRSLSLDLMVLLFTIFYILSFGRIQLPDILVPDYSIPVPRYP